MNWRKPLKEVAVLVVAALVAAVALQLTWPGAKTETLHGQVGSVKEMRVAAVGDSLTYGVGDATGSGGYVALLKADLASAGDYDVSTTNYGHSGDTSSQIMKRVVEQKKLRADMKKANIITVTVGGNDLMHVLQNHFFDITSKDIATGNTAFQKRLAKLLTELRSLNAAAPIYVFGIYNPFYVYFPQITAMEDSVKSWNKSTQQTIDGFKKIHYVDIDSVLSDGGTQDTTKSAKSSLEKAAEGDDDANPLIFDQDHFHPNNAGYAAMTKQLWTVMQDTAKEWE
ncbi:SGNH/GDSL hydrolase family protein [Lacticaseibacillus yichunensis]|uniref:SGNH/GDSL hydrolase family protein n=1 Tax=Lacticaseibacillus yichunensis TaxID=2486015 RepID=A0ABW4CQG4_9LACO|nr:SGNH/GDSL hydrolase family protein [Lacticaseibacillus yichunensis]